MRRYLLTKAPLLALVLALGVAPAGCAWTISPARSDRVSHCLASCGDQSPPEPQAGEQPQHKSFGLRDNRSSCEQRCHALK